MAVYSYDMNIQAASETEADNKMRSLTALAKKLKANELAKLADVVQNDPVKTAFAKKALGL